MKKVFRKSGKMQNCAEDNFLSKLSMDPFLRNAGVILIPFNVISNCRVVKLFIQGK